MSPNRFRAFPRCSRPLASALGAAGLVFAALGAPAGASTTTAVASPVAPAPTPAPQMSVSCTLTALKFNTGKALLNKEGATTADQINGTNLEKIALDEWYRKGCDQYGLMPIW